MTKAKSKIANKEKTNPRKRGNPNWKKGGQSPNPTGRPREGESWAGILRWAANLTGVEASELSPDTLRESFDAIGGLKLKEAIALRVMGELLSGPSSGLFNAVMDRAEGKLVQPSANIPWKEWARQNNIDPDAIIRAAEEIVEKVMTPE